MRGGATGAHGATGATGGLVVALVVDGVVGIVVVGGGETGVVVDVAAIDIRERVWRINLHISTYKPKKNSTESQQAESLQAS